VRSEKKRRIRLAALVLVAVGALWTGFHLPELAVRYVGWRVWFGSRGKVLLKETVLLPGPGLAIGEVVLTDWQKPPAAVSIRDLTIQRLPTAGSGAPLVIALNGKGSLGAARPHPLKITGRITGDPAAGNYQFEKIRIRIDRLGEVTLSGRLAVRGDSSQFSAHLADVSLAELSRAIDLPQLPTGGVVRGDLDFYLRKEKEVWQLQKVGGDLSFEGLQLSQAGLPPLSGSVAGSYDMSGRSGEITRASLKTPAGGQLSVNGRVGERGVDLSFTSEGLYLEEIIQALPEPVRQKLGLKLENLAGRVNYEPEQRLFTAHVDGNFHQARLNGDLNGNFPAGWPPDFLGRLDLEGLDLLAISRLYGEGAEISGLADLNLNFKAEQNQLTFLKARLETIPNKSFRQYLNVGALRALLALSSGAVIRHFAASDYGYRKLATAVTYQDGYLTIEGLARAGRDRDYIMLGGWLGNTVNIAVDHRFNTVSLEELKRRFQQLAEPGGVQVGQQGIS